MESEENYVSRPDEIKSTVLRAGRRTYFFDVRETKAGDYYLTITESKKTTHEDGSSQYKKHKIYLYKEDFQNFMDMLNQTINFIFQEKGEEVISERHKSDFEPQKDESDTHSSTSQTTGDSFNDLKFEDI